MYALIDCNNFYCSCERLFNPKLQGRPVIVLSNNDGCAIARNEEAKALGIDMGTPAFMLEPLISKHNIAVFSSNYTLYGDLSDRVMSTISSLVPHIEIYSIDEAFADLNHMPHQDLLTLGMKIRNRIRQDVGLPVSVGIAPTKTLAKMANRYAKKMRRDIGVFWAANDQLVNEMLHYTDIGDVWGVGHQYAQLLKRNGVHTAYDFTLLPEEWVRKNMTVGGQRLLNELKGTASLEWQLEAPPKKNICVSRAFGHLLTDQEEIKEALCNYAATISLKLRQQKSCAKRLEVFIQTNPHKREHQQYFRSIILQVPTASNQAGDIIKLAIRGLDLIFRKGYLYLKCGIVAHDLYTESQVQGNLFDTEMQPGKKQMMQAMDAINSSMGRDVVRMAVQGYEKRYRLKCEFRSAHYTTDINQLLKVRI